MKIKRSGSSYLLMVGLTALLIGGSWLIYEVYAASFRSQIEERQAKNILPLVGTLNKEAASNLGTRTKFDAQELATVTSVNYELEEDQPKSAPVEDLVETVQASDEAELEQASESASVTN